MKALEKIKNILINNKLELQKKYKVKELGIFGSYVKGEMNKKSDIDILVEYDEVPDLITFIDLKNYLSDLFGIKVDLVMKSALKTNIGKRILKEVVYI